MNYRASAISNAVNGLFQNSAKAAIFPVRFAIKLDVNILPCEAGIRRCTNLAEWVSVKPYPDTATWKDKVLGIFCLALCEVRLASTGVNLSRGEA